MKTRLAIVLLFLSAYTLEAQNRVKRNDTIKVVQGNKQLKMPWGSGLNAANLGKIDLDLDGKMDLFLFEPNNEANYDSGDKIYPFINQGKPGEVNYKLNTKYRNNFPILEDYAILKDWNCDGKVDIFTWDARARVTAYKNVSDTALKFQLEKKIIATDTTGLPSNPSYYHPGEIIWAYFDMPSFEDIDGDGDLDILTTASNGHFIEYNKNMSQELYGNCDSLTFKLKSTCWGQFFEDTGSVILNTCDVVNVPNPESSSGKRDSKESQRNKSGRHSSDALLAIDLNGDGVKDLLAGDGAERSLYSFINGGKSDSSSIVSYTSSFPAVDKFDATIYGLPFYLDVDNDNKKDLLISVALDKLEDMESIWFYKNTGSTSNPSFTLQSKSFLQGDMVDVGTQSKPIFFDYNNDSLSDIIIGNYGYFQELGSSWYNSLYTSKLALYENVGSKKEPAYELVDTNFADLPQYFLNLQANKRSYGYHPTFGDLDGDGDEDMIIGDHRGKVHYFNNVPLNGKAQFFLVSAEFQGIDVGDFSTPQLFDIDDNGTLDLLIGESQGNINYYKNTSATNPNFIRTDDTLGNINVKDDWDFVGYSSPFFFKDSLGVTKLLSGTKSGFIRYYDSIIVGDTLSRKFRRVEKSYQDMWDGIFSTIHGADIDDDGSLDFILGNQSGGLALYTSEDSIYIPGFTEITANTEIERVVYPNPASNEITLLIKCNCADFFEYTVYDVNGKVRAVSTSNNEVTFNLDQYEEGIYVIRAQNKNRSITLTERFLKID